MTRLQKTILILFGLALAVFLVFLIYESGLWDLTISQLNRIGVR